MDCDGSIESCQIKFTVDKIDINPACQTNSVPPAAGNKTVVLTVSMTTGTLSETGAALVDTIWNPTSLKSLSPDGSVADAVPGRCLSEAGKFPFAVLPNAKHTGTVEVEVPESATSIASTHPVREDGGRGWVWPIG
ncbi:hypothetical protein [Umezawaea tangerina]|uniref:Uncharacterized protein n=1 Tax=Umezawaea tangerina TaxID=84725 RepID=A0A2T0SPJ4_9PSEU|nr:hypothetical protein [Umezawaea tangerina]PRY35328.1 hypothetical protein CLV43_114246 [Umezawaea tangerina]